MKNIDFLVTDNRRLRNRSFKVCLNSSKKILCMIPGKFLNGDSIRKIIQNINEIMTRYNKKSLQIVIALGDKEIEDKLSYVMLECICYLLAEHYNIRSFVEWNHKSGISTDGIYVSPLQYINNKTIDEFKSKFKSEIKGNHFRKIIDGHNIEKTGYLGILYQDVDAFLRHTLISKDCSADIAELVAELVGNANEHSKTECLVDIDVTNEYTAKNEEGDKKYIGVNIAIVSFSNKLLGQDIRERFKNHFPKVDRFTKLKNAYTYHSYQFNDSYSEDDFYILASFQDKISGRIGKPASTGGTGLTMLIKSIQERSRDDYCYMITGNRVFTFKRQFLKYDSDNWLGFNEKSDFFSSIPSDKVLGSCPIYMPGTAYSLNFAIEMEDS